jgi:hypothetical protein
MNFDDWLGQQEDGVAACDHVTFGRKVWDAALDNQSPSFDSLFDGSDAHLLPDTALEQRLAEREKRLAEALMYALGNKLMLAEREKQIVMLRDAILAVCCDPEGTVCIRGSDGDRAVLQEALDATVDLSGCIICNSVPFRHMYRHEYSNGATVVSNSPELDGVRAIETIPLYKKKEWK